MTRATKLPFRGVTPDEQYRAVQWGCTPDEVLHVDVGHSPHPEQRLLRLGLLRKLWFSDGTTLVPSRPYPVVAWGAKDNRIYFVGGSTADMADAGRWGKPGIADRIVEQIDYQSSKGLCKRGKKPRKSKYYFHDHHAPFPRLHVFSCGWPGYVGGGYRVKTEGIVG